MEKVPTSKDTPDAESDDGRIRNLICVFSDGVALHRPRELKAGDNEIGRETHASWPASLFLSSSHANVRFVEPDSVTVADSKSRNGTFLNGKRVSVPVRAKHQDLLRCGRTLFLFSEERVSSGSPPTIDDDSVAFAADLREAFLMIRRAATKNDPVLILGETGTGKERAAEGIHRFKEQRLRQLDSNRKETPLVKINCAAIADSVLHSEIFGHVKGAFTGASAQRTGLLVDARGGTIFLDEIGVSSDTFHRSLLRVIETGKFRPVGASQELDVGGLQFVAATNRPIYELPTDLVARFKLKIRLPPLRRRKEDILPLIAYEWRKLGCSVVPRFTTDAAQDLLLYEWPANIRQLSAIANELLHSGDPNRELSRSLVRELIAKSDEEYRDDKAAEPAVQRRCNLKSLEAADWLLLIKEHVSISAIARHLGVDRKSVREHLKKFGLYERVAADDRDQ